MGRVSFPSRPVLARLDFFGASCMMVGICERKGRFELAYNKMDVGANGVPGFEDGSFIRFRTLLTF